MQCDMTFTAKGSSRKFCCKSCAATYSNTHRTRECTYIKQAVCLGCKQMFEYNSCNKGGKYCSNKCQQDYRFKTITIIKAKEGELNEGKTLKRVISYENGYQCQICNISSWNQAPISLHLDHIDGNSDNNHLDNLRLLCPNCHSQTETYCGRNFKNSKRATYNQRYRLRKLNITG